MKKLFNAKLNLLLSFILLLLPALYAQTTAVSTQSVPSAAAALAAQGAQAFKTYALPSAPRYGEEKYWLKLPAQEAPAQDIDVFYVYPTIFGGNGLEYQDFNDEASKKNAVNYINFNTAVAGDKVNVYAPYYRSGSIEVVNLDDNSLANFLSIPYQDTLKAFDYYMQHYNNGRPFILMGFSQGSMMIKNIMEQRFADKKLQDKLVAAYIVGWSVTKEDLEKYPFLKMAKGPKDTGVIISYNTELPNSGYSFLLRKGAQAINPVNWRTDGKPSKKSQYKGGLIYNSETGVVEGEEKPFKTARLEEGTNALVVDVDTSKYNANEGLFPAGILHIYDYRFFFNNLKDNATRRIKSYKKEHK